MPVHAPFGCQPEALQPRCARLKYDPVRLRGRALLASFRLTLTPRFNPDRALGNVFARMLTSLIDPGALVEIMRAIDMGWHALDDDVIVPKASERGFTHMVTCDKGMPSIVVAPIPILVVDDVVGDRTFMHDTAIAVANKMNSERLPPGYHPVPVEGYRPSKRLRRMLECER